MSRNYMSKYDVMRKGAVQQQREDGIFVIYGWKPMWNSDTAGRRDTHRLCMQDNCNFAMYKRAKKAMWHTNTQANGFNVCRVWLRNDGNLVIEKDGEEMWNSAQSRGSK
uniref:Bulb-type lectin domain-containing protein n=1 Tax=Hucho hucho TaxID=62062 RepID=A0A4W5NKF9_9TELE